MHYIRLRDVVLVRQLGTRTRVHYYITDLIDENNNNTRYLHVCFSRNKSQRHKRL